MKRSLAVVIFSLLIVLFIYPSAFIYTKDTLPDNNDTRLIAYIIGQVQENVIHHQPLFFGRFFAPDVNTLAYSDLFLISALITLPFRLFTDHPIIIFNLAFIINSVFTICASFLLFSYLFRNTWVSTITTLLFTLSGYHLHYYPHLQMFSLWLLLLSIYFFLRFQKENRPLYLTLFFLTLTAQIAESIFPAYLIFFTCFLIFVIQGLQEVPNTARNLPAGRQGCPCTRRASEHGYLCTSENQIEKMKAIILHSLPFLPFWTFLVFPYLKLHLSLPEAIRPIRDSANFSLGLEQIFTLYKSYTVIGIFLLAAIIKTKAKPWWYLFFFSLIMSLGPVLKIFGQTIRIFNLPIPLPYSLFYYFFPGFTGFRTPSRFIILALLAATTIIGYALVPFINKLKTKTKVVLILAIFSLLLLEADLPLKGFPVNINMHPVYQEVKALPNNTVILELPIKLWNMPDHEIESIRSLYSLFHKHRRFGGFSGFATNAWIDLIENINAFGLNAENLTKLHELGITHVIENNKLSPLP